MKEIYFQKDQIVYHQIYGQGVVEDILVGDCPILVKFKDNSYSFTHDGRWLPWQPISLSQTPIEPIVNKPLQISEFEEGELVWVRLDDLSEWHARYFSHQDFNREIYQFYCFCDQQKSGELFSFQYCVKFDQRPF